MQVRRYRHTDRPTWEVSNGTSWWVAVQIDDGDWSITSGLWLNPVNPSGTLGRKIIKAISVSAESSLAGA